MLRNNKVLSQYLSTVSDLLYRRSTFLGKFDLNNSLYTKSTHQYVLATGNTSCGLPARSQRRLNELHRVINRFLPCKVEPGTRYIKYLTRLLIGHFFVLCLFAHASVRYRTL